MYHTTRAWISPSVPNAGNYAKPSGRPPAGSIHAKDQVCSSDPISTAGHAALDYVGEMPFAWAAELISKSTGISFSEHTSHDFLTDFTDGLTLEDVILSEEEFKKRIAKVRGKSKRRPVLVAAADGAHLPTRFLPGR